MGKEREKTRQGKEHDMAKGLTEQLEELKRKVNAIEAGRKGVDKCRKNLAKAAAEYSDEYQKLINDGLPISTLEAEGIKPVTHVLYELGRDFRRNNDKPDDKTEPAPVEDQQSVIVEDSQPETDGQPYAEPSTMIPQTAEETNWNQQ